MLFPIKSTFLSDPDIVKVPEIRESIMKNQIWSEIIEYQKKSFFFETQESRKADYKRMAEIYGNESFQVLWEGFICNKCKKEASKRCSKCKSV